MNDVRADWAAARNSAALFDISDRALVELAGTDAAQFLHNLCTNDIKTLQPGRGCEFFLTTNKAKVVAHGIAHRMLPGEAGMLWLDLDPGSGAKVVAHLDRFIVSEQVEIADRTSASRQLHLCGSQATSDLTAVLPAVPSLENLQHAIVDGCRIVRNDRLGIPGYDLICPAAQGPELCNRLARAGAVVAGLETFNILRIEAGVPVDGIDIDPERFVVEVGRIKQAISYTKGCYLGQEPIVMARDRGHANRVFMGLKVDAAEPLAPGTKVMRSGEEVGQTTSSVWSPLLQSVVALAYLKRGSQEVGMLVDAGGNKAVVMPLPFAN